MPQFNYTHPSLLLGQVATANPRAINSYIVELLAQQSNVAISAAPAAGDYTIQIDAPEGTFTATYTSPGGETQAQVVAGMLAAVDAIGGLVNILVTVDASPVLELHFIHPGMVYAVAISGAGAVANGTLTTAVEAGGTPVGLGVAVVAGSGGVSTGAPHITAPDGATVDADVLGVSCRSTIDVQVNSGLSTAVDGTDPGGTVAVLEAGEVVVYTEGAVAFNGAAFVRIGAVPAGSYLGAFTPGPAVANEVIAITGARFRASTTGAGLVKVALNRP